MINTYELDVTPSKGIAVNCFIVSTTDSPYSGAVCIVFGNDEAEARSLYQGLYVYKQNEEYQNLDELKFFGIRSSLNADKYSGTSMSFITGEHDLTDFVFDAKGNITGFTQGVYDFFFDDEGWHYKRKNVSTSDNVICKYYCFLIQYAEDCFRTWVMADSESEALEIYMNNSPNADDIGDDGLLKSNVSAVNIDEYVYSKTPLVTDIAFDNIIKNIFSICGNKKEYREGSNMYVTSFISSGLTYRRQSWSWIYNDEDSLGMNAYFIVRTDRKAYSEDVIRCFNFGSTPEDAIHTYIISKESLLNEDSVTDTTHAEAYLADGVTLKAYEIDSYISSHSSTAYPESFDCGDEGVIYLFYNSANNIYSFSHLNITYVKDDIWGWSFVSSEPILTECYVIQKEDKTPVGYVMSSTGTTTAALSEYCTAHSIDDATGLSAVLLLTYVKENNVKVFDQTTVTEETNQIAWNTIPFSTAQPAMENIRINQNGQFYFKAGTKSYGPRSSVYIITRSGYTYPRGFSLKGSGSGALEDYLASSVAEAARDTSDDAKPLLSAVPFKTYLENNSHFVVCFGMIAFEDGTEIENIVTDSQGIYRFTAGNICYMYSWNGFYESSTNLLSKECYIIVRHFRGSKNDNGKNSVPYTGDYARTFVFANSRQEAYDQYCKSGSYTLFEANDTDVEYLTDLEPYPISTYASMEKDGEPLLKDGKIVFDDFRMWDYDTTTVQWYDETGALVTEEMITNDNRRPNNMRYIENVVAEDGVVKSFTHSCYDFTLDTDGWRFAQNGKSSLGSVEEIPDNIAGAEVYIFFRETTSRPDNLGFEFGSNKEEAVKTYIEKHPEYDGDSTVQCLKIDDYIIKYRLRASEIVFSTGISPLSRVLYDSEVVYYFRNGTRVYDKGYYGWLYFDNQE